MKNLRPETINVLKRVETLSGCPVEFKPDSSLTLRATLKMARNGAPSHVLQYRPTNDPLDYWVTYQAGFAMRLFDLPPNERFNFVGTGVGADQVHALLATGQPLDDSDQGTLAEFAQMVLHWALLNLRSYAIGMRIDQWIADEHPHLRELQASGMDILQQENLQLLSRRFGNLSIPVPLLAPVAASALFADRLLGKSIYAIPYRAAGVIESGAELLEKFDTVPRDGRHDRELVDAWAASMGMTDWYRWSTYEL